MPNVNPGKFANPEILSRIERNLLLTWLFPMRDYFARRGLNLPPPERGQEATGTAMSPPHPAAQGAGRPSPVAALLCARDYERLAKILAEPAPDMPPELLEALYIFRELDHEAAMDALLEVQSSEFRVQSSTPLDIVVRAWLTNRKLVQALHNRMELGRPRSFQYFSTTIEPVPAFAGPATAQLTELERRLNSFFEACGRGRGARVFASQSANDWVFLIRHGAPCRREGTMEREQPASIFYRPLRHDVMKYDAARGEMAINCCAERERRVLLRIFGSCLFGQPDFFPGTAKYTLAPLVLSGRACLACGDVPGIEKLNLTEIELQIEEEPRHRDILKAKDLFKLVESGKLTWPRNLHEIKRATFQVKFWRAPRPRQLTIVPCNRVLYGREEDSGLLEKLMMARGFIQQRRSA